MIILWKLKEACRISSPLFVFNFPENKSLKARESRPTESLDGFTLTECVKDARAVLMEELEARLFKEVASNSRMVLAFMTKQKKAVNWLNNNHLDIAKT
eukprot:2195502-Prorocentrum_lima.AAC.1